MDRFYLIRVTFFLGLIALLLAGCNGGSAPDTVEAYLQALVAKDENQMINLSCGAWEAQAKQEFDSFAAVADVKLEGLTCQEAGQDRPYTLVSCSGKIIASYGAEDLEIELAERLIQTVQEGGEWRMCGYR